MSAHTPSYVRPTLTTEVSTRLTDEDALHLHHLARLGNCTEEQIVRFILRQFIKSKRASIMKSDPDPFADVPFPEV